MYPLFVPVMLRCPGSASIPTPYPSSCKTLPLFDPRAGRMAPREARDSIVKIKIIKVYK